MGIGRVASLAALGVMLAGCFHHSRVAPLEIGYWRALQIDGRIVIPRDMTRRPWLHFSLDSSRVTGSGGCNRLSGPFTIDGTSLTFGALIMTRMACVDTALDSQENAFVAALNATDHYTISGDTLTLYSAGQATVRFGH